MTRSLALLAERLLELGVTRVVMEATSDYWKPPFYLLACDHLSWPHFGLRSDETHLLEAHGFEPWLVNAKDVKHLPRRPKTDKLDAVWLCKVAERQMLRASFVPPPPIRRLRDLTRYRIDLVGTRTAEKNRVEKLLEDAQIKLSAVASDTFGVSGRDMMAALVAGERAPKTLAALARRRLKAKIPQLEEDFRSLHRALRVPAGQDAGPRRAISADIADIDARIEELIAPFADALDRLDEIPGVGRTAAAVIIAEIGTDMTRFPTPGASRLMARFAPGVKESAGKKNGAGGTGHGNPNLARALGEAALGASRTPTFLGERYRRLGRRRGKKKPS